MKRRRHMPDMKEGTVNVTPLIDIVMVLIVFFMLVAKIGVSRGADDDIPLPATILGKTMDSLSNTLTLNIHINKSGDEPFITALVDGQKRDLHLTKEYRTGTDAELQRVLEAFHKQFLDKATIILRADKDLPYRELEPILLACASAGIGNLSYETKPGVDSADVAPAP
jgi:biopolymer transport protein ExbD